MYICFLMFNSNKAVNVEIRSELHSVTNTLGNKTNFK